MKLQFWGATDDVTGSMTFLHLEDGILMIDAGLTQGLPEAEALNLLPLPVSPKDIKAVVVTHAHLDHSGYLPRLVKKGFRGPIFCTPATARLMRIILLDSAKLNEDDFYDEKDAQAALNLLQIKDWHHPFESLKAEITMLPAGHILGASSVKIKVQHKTMIFSGDLGRFDDPILPEHESCPAADLIIIESTYGGKNRSGDLKAELERFLTTVAKESRVGIIASFAVARGQLLQTLIADFYERHPELKVRVCVDSPMMVEANKVYKKYSHLTRHPDSIFDAMDRFDLIEHQREWQSLSRKQGPLIIISSSGMVSGGRIHRHLYNWRHDEKAILFLPGYQGQGTPGRKLKEGQRELIGPDAQPFLWKGEVWSSEAFSSHADQNELIRWLDIQQHLNSNVFLLHGEAQAKIELKKELQKQGLKAVDIPNRGDIFS